MKKEHYTDKQFKNFLNECNKLKKQPINYGPMCGFVSGCCDDISIENTKLEDYMSKWDCGFVFEDNKLNAMLIVLYAQLDDWVTGNWGNNLDNYSLIHFSNKQIDFIKKEIFK